MIENPKKRVVVPRIEDDRTWIERFVSPGVIATILIAVMGQTGVSIIYQVINNEQQEAKIKANTDEAKYLREQVFTMQTPLSQKFIKLEDQVVALRNSHDELGKRLDQIDTAGTRALSLVTANQQRVMSQVDRLGDRLIMQDKVVSEIGSKTTNIVPVFQTKLDEMTRNISRIEEQQRRIIEALDNLYSTVSKIPPVLRSDPKK